MLSRRIYISKELEEILRDIASKSNLSIIGASKLMAHQIRQIPPPEKKLKKWFNSGILKI
jgi:hypothetical protein